METIVCSLISNAAPSIRSDSLNVDHNNVCTVFSLEQHTAHTQFGPTYLSTVVSMPRLGGFHDLSRVRARVLKKLMEEVQYPKPSQPLWNILGGVATI
jgi:hypothetical protein